MIALALALLFAVAPGPSAGAWASTSNPPRCQAVRREIVRLDGICAWQRAHGAEYGHAPGCVALVRARSRFAEVC